MIRLDWNLNLNPQTMSVRDMIDVAARHARLVWAGSALSIVVYCAIAWRVDIAVSASPFPVWDRAPLLYALSAVAAVGALLVRQRAYGRAQDLRLDVQRASMSGAGPGSGPVLAEALMELSRRELSVWTLAGGPALVALPCAILSGDAMPMMPLALISFFLMALTFPNPARFAREAGITDPHGTSRV